MANRDEKLDDIVDDNRGSFFDALRVGGFRLVKGDESKGSYSIQDYLLLYEKQDNDFYRDTVLEKGLGLIIPQNMKLRHRICRISRGSL